MPQSRIAPIHYIHGAAVAGSVAIVIGSALYCAVTGKKIESMEDAIKSNISKYCTLVGAGSGAVLGGVLGSAFVYPDLNTPIEITSPVQLTGTVIDNLMSREAALGGAAGGAVGGLIGRVYGFFLKECLYHSFKAVLDVIEYIYNNFVDHDNYLTDSADSIIYQEQDTEVSGDVGSAGALEL